MVKTLAISLVSLCFSTAALAQGLRPLNDNELEKVSGRDGIGIAMHLELNQQTAPNNSADSRIAMGFNVNGNTNYIVIRNPRGMLDVIGLSVSVQKRSDGNGDYVAIGLPGYMNYGNFGIDSLSVQTDPTAPVTNSLGRFNINGTLNMQGQIRMWAH